MSRIYIVSTKKTGKSRLVRSNSKNNAVRFIAAESFDVRYATHDEIYQVMQSGATIANALAPAQVDIEDAGEKEGQ